MTTAARTTSRKPNAKAIAAKVAEQTALMENLEAFVEESADDERIMALIEKWTTKYSERNATLVVMQRPSATDLRGYKAWLAEGRQVRKGQKGIRILAPAGNATTEKELPNGELETSKGRSFYRLISVFDIRQTEEIPAEG